MNQIFNPFLPLYEYIPDGEPHIFNNRVYLFGSHDQEGGDTFCMLDYAVWSAPVHDLKSWQCEGVIYQAKQDPLYSPERSYMYAPDVVQGNDGRYYLYYCLSGKFGKDGYSGVISVAVCDAPAGKYQYLGFVRNPDGSPMKTYICFDPAVMNDHGTIRLYYGTAYPYEEEPDFRKNQELIQKECEMFGKSSDEILNTPESVMGASVCVLEEDMLTVKEPPKHIIPYAVKNTDFEEHPFFEAASMRKVGNKYYFIYSSWQNHELCYAVSDFPDRGFRFGGTIVSNGDIGYQGRLPEDRLNMTGTTHGSIICIQNQWYVFYHRLTHKSDYSRQACAERIQILPDGSIPQVEVTSCGLNGEPLIASGTYPAVIACNITNGNMPHGSNQQFTEHFPHVTHQNQERFISEISDHTLLGYKYFRFNSQINPKLRLRYQATDHGKFTIYIDAEHEIPIGEAELSPCQNWNDITVPLPELNGIHPLFLKYSGTGEVSLLELEFLSDAVNPEADHIQKSSLFMALTLVAGAGIFLAGASLLGRMMNQPEPEILDQMIETIQSTEAPETIYFPPSVTETESYRSSRSTTTTTPNIIGAGGSVASYPQGEYAIGEDIPPGLYLAVSENQSPYDQSEYGEFYFGIYAEPYSEAEGTPTIGGGWHQNYWYVELEEGQYIHFSHSTLYAYSEGANQLDPYSYSGMFKVYHDHLKAGRYTLIGDLDYPGEFAVYDDIRAGAEPLFTSEYLIEGQTAEVVLEETQYLEMNFCHIIEESYPEGTYEVGRDIPPGLYVAVFEPKTTWDNDFLLEVYDDSSTPIIGGLSHQYRYVELKENDVLYVEHATIYNAEYTRHVPEPFYTDGMFWVGHDFPAGTYTVQGGYSDSESMVIVYDSAGTDANVLTAKTVDSEYTIELHEGEFIELRDCYLQN